MHPHPGVVSTYHAAFWSGLPYPWHQDAVGVLAAAGKGLALLIVVLAFARLLRALRAKAGARWALAVVAGALAAGALLWNPGLIAPSSESGAQLWVGVVGGTLLTLLQALSIPVGLGLGAVCARALERGKTTRATWWGVATLATFVLLWNPGLIYDVTGLIWPAGPPYAR